MPAKRTVKRYTEEEKSEILAFVEKFNAENGRGGQTAAVNKYKVTPMTLSAWNKKSGKKAKKSVITLMQRLNEHYPKYCHL